MSVTKVTKENFREVLPKLKEELKICEFVAIDAEFSGLVCPERQQFSLFDSPAERYKKMQSWPFRILQFGIALFKFDAKKNEWLPSCYNCMVFPVAFETEKLSETVLCQVSSLVFLRQHNFNFNKWISDGIPYMNAAKAKKISRYLKIHRSCFQTGSPVDKETLSVSHVYRRKMNQKSPLTDEDIKEIVDDLKGFSHVIDAIGASGKCVIGHNVYMDLFLTYKDFCNTLPDTYEEFKSKLHSAFPHVIDTKRLAHGIKDTLAKKGCEEDDLYFEANLLTDTNLFALHFSTQLTDKFSPKIVVGDEYKSLLELGAQQRIESIPNSLCHEAAFDACVTGCLFIQLAYLLERPSLRFRISHATAGDLLFACSPWVNMVNVTRCTVPYINLCGKDPTSHRPPNIVIISSTKKWSLPAKLDALHKNLPKFGDYDIRVEGRKIVITCGNHGCYKGVMRYLQQSGFIIEDGRWRVLRLLSDYKRLALGSVSVVIGGAVAMLWFLSRRSLPPKGM